MTTKVEVAFPFPEYDYQARQPVEGGKTYQPGDKVELPDDVARMRIADGHAVLAEGRSTKGS